MNNSQLLKEVTNYYSGKLARYGESPRGVDWNNEEGQRLRFFQLTKIIQGRVNFSISDVGCGYGALVDYLIECGLDFSYIGLDISSAMVDVARKRYQSYSAVNFIVASDLNKKMDYSVASGIFNVRFNIPNKKWEEYVKSVLDSLNKFSQVGFAFNCLTNYSDAEKKRDDLYYADPCFWFDFCKRNYSRHVSLLHDYGLYEFTILVRKNDERNYFSRRIGDEAVACDRVVK